MVARPHSILGALLLAAGLVTGCQGSGGPAAPVMQENAASPAPAMDAAPVPPGVGLLAVARLEVDRTSGLVTLEPLRTGQAIGDTFPLDATAFFTQDPCRDCLKVTGFAFRSDVLTLDVTIRHPFPNTAQRQDLDVFDPRVILYLPDRPEWGATDFGGQITYRRPLPSGGFTITPVAGNTRSGQASGYTTRFDERVDTLYGLPTNGNLHPYIDYALDLLPNDPGSGANPWRRLNQSRSPETQVFKINLPPTIEVFASVLILEASYGQSATRTNRLNPQYYNPAFNRKEAFKVEYGFVPPLSMAYGNTINVSVSAADWQHPAGVDPAYPDPGNPGGLPVESTIAYVEVAAAGWTQAATPIITPSFGDGTELSPLVFSANLPRTATFPPKPGTRIPVLIRVIDSLNGTPIGNQNPAFDLGQVYDVSAYQIFEIGIGQPLMPRLQAVAPGFIHRDANAQVRTAPYALSTESTSQLLPIYPNALNLAGEAPAPAMRLLSAPSTADFRIVNPGTVALAARAEFYAQGDKPIDDYPSSPAAHPNPAVNMPVPFGRLAAHPDGTFMAGFGDNNLTVNPIRFSTGLTDRVPNSAIVRTWTPNILGPLVGPRLSAGCGSAPGPTLGSFVRGVISAPGVTFSSRSKLMGFVTAGANSEACSRVARLDYYGAPYNSESQRALTVDLTQVADALWGPTPTQVQYSLLANVRPLRYRAATNTWYHAVFINDRILLFDALEGFNPVSRTSNPSVLATRLSPLETLVDAAFIPHEPSHPFALDMFSQSADWLLLLTRSLAGYRLIAIEPQPASFTLAPISDLDGTFEGWGALTPLCTGMAFDTVNRMLVLSYDSNGVSAGGDMLFSLLAVQ